MKQINWLGWATTSAQVLLGSALAWAWFTPQLQIKNSQWEPPEPVKVDIEALLPKQIERVPPEARKEEQLLLQMQDRPLFALSRRPPPPPPPPPPPKKQEPPPEPDQWAMAKVSGLFDGAVTGAIVQYDGKEQRLMVGQSLGGWKLLRVQGREIELERNGVQRRLQLTRAALEKGPAMPAAGARGGRLPNYPGSSSGQAPSPGDAREAGQTAPSAPPEEGASLGGGIVR